jgi:type IV pilus assembly protein PilM
MFSSERILALDIGASKLVLAEFSQMKGGGIELLNYGSAPIGLDPDATTESSAYIVTGIRELMRAHAIHPGKVSLSISGQNVIPKNVKLPPVAKDKIGQVVRFEAQNNVPFPIEEVVWDYLLTGEEDGQLSVLIVAVKEELVAKITDCVMAAGLDPEIVDVSPLALYNAVRYNYGDLPDCTMILDMGARSTDVVFVEGDRIFNRSIPVAGNVITRELMKEFDLSFEDAEKLKMAHAFVGFGGTYESGETGVAERASKVVRNVMTRLHAEVSRTINFYRSQQGGSQPSLALLAGGSSVIPHANTFLKEKLKIDVDYLNPFRNVAVSEKIPTDQIAEDVSILGQVVGTALRRVNRCPSEINLMPRELVRRKTFERRLPFFGVTALGLVLSMLIWWVYFHRVGGNYVRRMETVQQSVGHLDSSAQAIDVIGRQKQAVYVQADSLAALVRRRTQWLEMFSVLHDHLSEGMWINYIGMSPRAGGDGSYLEIRGRAFSDKVKLEAISEFAGSLKGKGYFSEEVQVKKVKPVQGTDFLNEFTIEIGVKP